MAEAGKGATAPSERPATPPLPPMGRSVALLVAIALVSLGTGSLLLSQYQVRPGWAALALGAALLYWLPGKLPGLRERRERREALDGARRLDEAVTKDLSRRGHRLPTEIRARLQEAQTTLRAAIASNQPASLDEATEALDLLADAHLSGTGPRPLRRIASIVRQAGPAVLAALLLRAFFYEAFRIPSGSMVPTLLVGDHLFVNKFVYGVRVPFTLTKLWARFPERGDVVVFNRPGDESGDDVIKRVIGFPNETIDVRDGKVTICAPDGSCEPLETRLQGRVKQDDNGDTHKIVRPHETFDQYRETVGEHVHVMQVRVPHQELGWPPIEGCAPPWKVKPGHVFVMGDNRDNSQDSRFCRQVGGFGQVPVEHIKGRADLIWLSLGGPYGLRFDRMFSRLP